MSCEVSRVKISSWDYNQVACERSFQSPTAEMEVPAFIGVSPGVQGGIESSILGRRAGRWRRVDVPSSGVHSEVWGRENSEPRARDRQDWGAPPDLLGLAGLHSSSCASSPLPARRTRRPRRSRRQTKCTSRSRNRTTFPRTYAVHRSACRRCRRVLIRKWPLSTSPTQRTLTLERLQ